MGGQEVQEGWGAGQTKWDARASHFVCPACKRSGTSVDARASHFYTLLSLVCPACKRSETSVDKIHGLFPGSFTMYCCGFGLVGRCHLETGVVVFII